MESFSEKAFPICSRQKRKTLKDLSGNLSHSNTVKFNETFVVRAKRRVPRNAVLACCGSNVLQTFIHFRGVLLVSEAVFINATLSN